MVQAFLNQKLLENSFEKQFGTFNRLSNDINMSLWLEQLTRATQVQFTYFNIFDQILDYRKLFYLNFMESKNINFLNQGGSLIPKSKTSKEVKIANPERVMECQQYNNSSNINNNIVYNPQTSMKSFSGVNNSTGSNTMTSGYSTSTNLSSSMTGSSMMSASMTSSGASSSGTISSLTSPLQNSSTNMTSPSSASTMSISSPRQMEVKDNNSSISSSSVATLTPSGNKNKDDSTPVKNVNHFKRTLDPSKM